MVEQIFRFLLTQNNRWFYFMSDCTNQADVYLAMDASGSIDVDNFELMKTFAQTLVNSLAVGFDSYLVFQIETKTNVIHVSKVVVVQATFRFSYLLHLNLPLGTESILVYVPTLLNHWGRYFSKVYNDKQKKRMGPGNSFFD